MQQERTKIFIIEKNKLFALLLEAEIRNVFAGKNLALHVFENAELCQQFMHIEPDLVIVNHDLNSHAANAMTGLELAHAIRAKNSRADVVLVGDDEETELFLRAQNFDAYDYLIKNTELQYKLNYSLREWLKLNVCPENHLKNSTHENN